MAHEMLSNDHMMLGSGQKAWHGLGTVIEGLATAKEALELAKLDWTVRKEAVAIASSGAIVPGLFVTVRDDDDTCLGDVGSNYRILQNVDVFSVFDAIAERGDCIIETAGSLFGGATVFVTATIPGLIHVGSSKDVVQKYLLVTNSHDGTSSVTVKLIATRVVCNNTLSAALREKGKQVKIRHTDKLNERVAMATEALGIANKNFLEMEAGFNAMAAHSMSQADVKAYLESCFKVKAVKLDKQKDNQEDDMVSEDKKANNRVISKVGEIYETSAHLPEGDNLWKAFNAVTEWTNHHRTHNEHQRSQNTKADNKLNSLLFGQSADLHDRAFSEAMKLVSAGPSVSRPTQFSGVDTNSNVALLEAPTVTETTESVSFESVVSGVALDAVEDTLEVAVTVAAKPKRDRSKKK